MNVTKEMGKQSLAKFQVTVLNCNSTGKWTEKMGTAG